MQLTRVISGAVGLALVATLNLGLAGSAEAAPRKVPIKGVKAAPRVLYIKGVIGADFASKTVVVQRKVRPSSPWQKWKKAKTSKAGKYKVRVYLAPGSPATCYRVKVRAFGGLGKGTSRPKCVFPS